MIDSAIMWAVFEDPTVVTGFSVEEDDYPIDLQGIDFIKESMYKLDISMFMNGRPDEVNDANGKV